MCCIGRITFPQCKLNNENSIAIHSFRGPADSHKRVLSLSLFSTAGVLKIIGFGNHSIHVMWWFSQVMCPALSTDFSSSRTLTPIANTVIFFSFFFSLYTYWHPKSNMLMINTSTLDWSEDTNTIIGNGHMEVGQLRMFPHYGVKGRNHSTHSLSADVPSQDGQYLPRWTGSRDRHIF